MSKRKLTPEVLSLVAMKFKALSEPARLNILNCMRFGEMTVTDLVEKAGLGQANLSKHLHLLHSLGFVRRRKEGLYVYYALADKGILQLCDVMCGRIEAEAKETKLLFDRGPRRIVHT